MIRWGIRFSYLSLGTMIGLWCGQGAVGVLVQSVFWTLASAWHISPWMCGGIGGILTGWLVWRHRWIGGGLAGWLLGVFIGRGL